jgi:hypothetical protein
VATGDHRGGEFRWAFSFYHPRFSASAAFLETQFRDETALSFHDCFTTSRRVPGQIFLDIAGSQLQSGSIPKGFGLDERYGPNFQDWFGITHVATPIVRNLLLKLASPT